MGGIHQAVLLGPSSKLITCVQYSPVLSMAPWVIPASVSQWDSVS
jgi:hypothetical protein